MNDIKAIKDTKFGPIMGKKAVNMAATGFTVYESEHESRPFFLVEITGPDAGGDLKYEDAFGNEHTETFAKGQIITGGTPGSSHLIPMQVRKVYAEDSTVTDIMVSW